MALEKVKKIQESQCFKKEEVDKEIKKGEITQVAIIVGSILLIIVVALAAGIWVAWKKSLSPKVDYVSMSCPDCHRRFEHKDDLEAHCIAQHQYSYYERYETLTGSPLGLSEEQRRSEFEPSPHDPSKVEVRVATAYYTT